MLTNRTIRPGVAVLLLLGGCACSSLPTPIHSVKVIPVAPASTGSSSDGDYASATAAIDRRDYALALDFLQAARERKPEDIRVLNAFGVVYDKLGRFDLSARYYAQAQALNPNSEIVKNNIAYSRVLQRYIASRPSLLAETPVATVDPRATRLAKASTPQPSSAATKIMLPLLAAAPAPAPLRRPTVLTARQDRPADALVSVRSAAPAILPAVPPVAQSRTEPTAPATIAAPPQKEALVRIVKPMPRTVSQSPERQLASYSALGRDVGPAQRLALELAEAPPAADAAVSTAQPPAEWQGVVVRLPAILATPRPAAYPIAPTLQLAGANAYGAYRLTRSAPSGLLLTLPLRTGHPLVVVNASGRLHGAEPVRVTLASLGWSAPRSLARESRRESRTAIYYSEHSRTVAMALARTLSTKPQMVMCGNACPGVRLVVGTDFDIARLRRPKGSRTWRA